jgi:hypothetical protein
MPKRSSKKPAQKDTQQIARGVLDKVAPEVVPPKKKPGRPVKKQDAADVDRADAEGMAQPQGTAPEKNPAAVALGRLGGLKGGAARAKKLSKAKRSEIAAKAARARWAKPAKKRPAK